MTRLHFSPRKSHRCRVLRRRWWWTWTVSPRNRGDAPLWSYWNVCWSCACSTSDSRHTPPSNAPRLRPRRRSAPLKMHRLAARAITCELDDLQPHAAQAATTTTVVSIDLQRRGAAGRQGSRHTICFTPPMKTATALTTKMTCTSDCTTGTVDASAARCHCRRGLCARSRRRGVTRQRMGVAHAAAVDCLTHRGRSLRPSPTCIRRLLIRTWLHRAPV